MSAGERKRKKKIKLKTFLLSFWENKLLFFIHLQNAFEVLRRKFPSSFF
jgi:hypothetical protein